MTEGNPRGTRPEDGSGVSDPNPSDRQLEESEERYRRLLQAIPDIVYKIDQGGHFTFLNPSIRNLGYEPDELLGKHFSVIVHPEDRDRVSRTAVLPKLTGRATGDETAPKLFDERRTGPRMTRNLEVRLLPKRGPDVMVGSVFSYGEIVSIGEYDRAIEAKDKQFLGTVGIIRDISEREEMERRQKALQEELLQSEKMRAMGQMISGVAHELNNPLTSILGYAQLMLSSARPGEEGQSDLEAICSEAKRCAAIVQHLTAFARKKGFRVEPCNLNRVISDVLKLRTYQMAADRIELTLDLDDALPQTMADPNQLQQVFVNIFNNAMHILSEKKSGSRAIAISSRLDGETLRISVQDSGKGIPEEHLRRIFEPFFTTKDAGQGLGLGLSVCFRIVSDHGGKIWAESKAGEGSTFVIELPVVPPPLEYDLGTDAEGQPPRRGRGETILVVEDEPANRRLLERFFGQLGYRLKGVAGVEDAIRWLGEPSTRVELILSDYKMPGRSGRELYQYLRDRHPGLERRFVLMSGDVLYPGMQEFIEETHVRVLEKPFDLVKAAHLVGDLLSTQS